MMKGLVNQKKMGKVLVHRKVRRHNLVKSEKLVQEKGISAQVLNEEKEDPQTILIHLDRSGDTNTRMRKGRALEEFSDEEVDEQTWKELTTGTTPWFESDNDSYIYLNRDGRWWIDDPSGAGVYIAKHDGASETPPTSGYVPLSGGELPVPQVVTADRY